MMIESRQNIFQSLVGDVAPDAGWIESQIGVLKSQNVVAYVVKQLRLRNIGGIIIVDFIDMSREADRKKVSDALREAQRRDKARTSALKISELGLVQMTRKRTRESLGQLLLEPCAHCDGLGRLRAAETIAYGALRRLEHVAGEHASGEVFHDLRSHLLGAHSLDRSVRFQVVSPRDLQVRLVDQEPGLARVIRLVLDTLAEDGLRLVHAASLEFEPGRQVIEPGLLGSKGQATSDQLPGPQFSCHRYSGE
jgi:hypothetical protein